jgi:lipid-A-disaccharide synthase-like uncharacterized protein
VEGLGIYALGFFGQALFGARLIVQLILSERQKRVVSPTVFWQLSLAASFIFMIYGVLREDLVIVGGQTISYYIYIRNLQLKNVWRLMPRSIRLSIIFLPPATIIYVLLNANFSTAVFTNVDYLHPVILMGAIGQLALNLRFVYQWYAAEKARESVLPVGFWIISTWASVLVILYAAFHPFHGYDPVLLVSQGMGIFVYMRNLVLYKRGSVQKCTTIIPQNVRIK